MPEYLKAGETFSGRQGSVFATIDGRNVPMLEIQNIEGNVDLTKGSMDVLNQNMTQHRAVGASGSGSWNKYKTTQEYAKIALEFVKTGYMPELSLKVTNDDPGSKLERQTTIVYGVIPDSVSIFKLDVGSEFLDEDMDFTFNSAEIL